jgi:pimeloyl-ACP methyl ester carboxylesterase
VGVRDDGLAAVTPWGFDVASIRVPVAIWQGREDAMVPFAHGEWLAAHVPGAEAHLLDDEGHLTLVTKLDEIMADLKRLAGLE